MAATSIGNLPDEVLAEIFHSIACEIRKTKKPNRWLYLTHVCSRWRNVALEYPRLWAAPPFHKKDYVEAMLRRARATPLDIVIDFIKCREPSCLELATGNLHRARELTLLADCNAEFHDSYSGKKFDAPLLKSITIVDSDAKNFLLDKCQFLDLISITAPQLQILSLENSRLPKKVALTESFQLITTLTIVNPPNTSYSIVTKGDFLQNILAYLKNLLHLRYLQLERAICKDKITATTHLPRVYLPKLSTLTFRDWASNCRAFLEVVDFADSAHVVLECSEDFPMEFVLAINLAMGRLRDPIRTLRVKSAGGPGSGPHFDVWTSSHEQIDYANETPILSIICVDSIAVKDGFQGFLDGLEHLIFKDKVLAPLWLLESLPELKFLEVSQTSLALLNFLSPKQDWASFLELKKKPKLPSIRDLILKQWWLDEEDLGSIFDDFIEGLDVRRRCGYGLTRLHLWKCEGLASRQIEALRNVVDNLEIVE